MTSEACDPDALDRIFSALADPTRRRIVAALAAGPRAVSALAEPLPMSLVAVSKHIAMLERAGLVSRVKQGRAHVCRLRPARLGEASEWLASYRRFCAGQLDALDRFLAEDRHGCHDQP